MTLEKRVNNKQIVTFVAVAAGWLKNVGFGPSLLGHTGSVSPLCFANDAGELESDLPR